jgi:alcohol dehydrogenase (cytochrome c)
MKVTSLLASVLTLWPAFATAQTMQDLIENKNTDHVLVHSGGYDRKNYSPLNQINRSNIKRLVPMWSTSLMNDAGELSAPAVYNGVMYVINGKFTFALDLETGRQIWRTPVETEPGVTRVSQYGAFTRGAPTLYNGKLFRVTIDNHIVALDQKTGKEIWKQKFAEWREGYYSTGAPIIANGVLISGMAGGESTTRGFLDGWDPETGKKLWRRYTIPEPGQPGSETWPANSDAWTRGGGPTWRSGSYDPQLDLVYWGTGNAEPYDPRPRGELDSLYTSSVLAIRPKTGELVCYFQYTPNDVYDVDGADENTLVDLPVNGTTRKVMIQSNKNGFLFVLDRTNCKPIAINPFVKVNWASHYDLTTGRPVHTDIYKKFLSGDEVEVWPSRGTNAVPNAYNPNTGLIYMSTWNIPRIMKLAPPRPQVLGTDSTGVIPRTAPIKPGDVVGHFVAMNPLTAEKKWEVPLTDLPGSAGVLATAGGLLFSGRLTGEFVALDQDTGKTLWQFKTGSSVNSAAITYTHKGTQYVAVASGLGGSVARRLVADKVPAGGAMWTFALMPE